MQIPDLNALILEPALSLLPEPMASPRARAVLVAIALQESGLDHRRQLAGGPARGWWQFEEIGVEGVLSHHATVEYAQAVCTLLGYSLVAEDVYVAIEDNDLLAACFARLLLWRHPDPLPETRDDGWHQYITLWRPGITRIEKWNDNWYTAMRFYGLEGRE